MNIDVVVITALKEEFDAVRAVSAGALGDWTRQHDSSGFPYDVRQYACEPSDQPLQIALAQAVDMGSLAASQVAARLVKDLDPRCLAMCGICAGRRGEVSLGDVIVADRVYKYDDGKMKVRETQPGIRIEDVRTDLKTYNLDPRWKLAAQHFPTSWSESLSRQRPPTLHAQENWLLHGLFTSQAGGPPLKDHEDRRAKCPRWTFVVERLRNRGWVTKKGVQLTRTGLKHIEEQFDLYPDGLPDDRPFRVHVGPIATGSQVIEDDLVFDRLEKAVRKVLGLEMEAAAIGLVAEIEKLAWMIVAKGVCDHADTEKDDSFHTFAARASSEFLLVFLRRELPLRENATRRIVESTSPSFSIYLSSSEILISDPAGTTHHYPVNLTHASASDTEQAIANAKSWKRAHKLTEQLFSNALMLERAMQSYRAYKNEQSRDQARSLLDALNLRNSRLIADFEKLPESVRKTGAIALLLRTRVCFDAIASSLAAPVFDDSVERAVLLSERIRYWFHEGLVVADMMLEYFFDQEQEGSA